MNLYIVTDIFGCTEHVEKFQSDLAGRYSISEIIDPYSGKNIPFDNEEEAYRTFTEFCGHDSYNKLVFQKITSTRENCNIIAFSAGASAVWNIASSEASKYIKNAYLFYGSRVRHSIDVEPKFRTELIFPARENHFDVDEVVKRVCGKKNVECLQTDFLHGFMNPCSDNYDPDAYKLFIDRYL